MEKLTTSTNTFSSSLTEEEQNLFAFDDICISPCIDQGSDTHNIEPQLYLESLSSRVSAALRSSKGFTEVSSRG